MHIRCLVWTYLNTHLPTSLVKVNVIIPHSHTLQIHVPLRTVSNWHNSLVVKRVFFECFDCFMPLLYIAFYQLDVITLKAEIVSLFMSMYVCMYLRAIILLYTPSSLPHSPSSSDVRACKTGSIPFPTPHVHMVQVMKYVV